MTLLVFDHNTILVDETRTKVITFKDGDVVREHHRRFSDGTKIIEFKNKWSGLTIIKVIVGTVYPNDPVENFLTNVHPDIFKNSDDLKEPLTTIMNSNIGTDSITFYFIPKYKYIIRYQNDKEKVRLNFFNQDDKIEPFNTEGLDPLGYNLYKMYSITGKNLDLTTEELFSIIFLNEFEFLGETYSSYCLNTGALQTGRSSRLLIKEQIPDLFKRNKIVKELLNDKYKNLKNLKLIEEEFI